MSNKIADSYTPEQLVKMQEKKTPGKSKEGPTTEKKDEKSLQASMTDLTKKHSKPHTTTKFYSTFFEDDLYYFHPSYGDMLDDAIETEPTDTDTTDKDFICTTAPKQKSPHSKESNSRRYRTRSLTAKGRSITQPIEIES